MSYFKQFPIIEGYELNGKRYAVVDITKRTGFQLSNIDKDRISIEYNIKEGETPEILADRMYDSPDLYWIIMMFNNIFDISDDWPLDYYVLEQYVDEKYANPNDIHHYKSMATNAIVSSDHPGYDRMPVTNFEHEYDLNESKRIIRLIDPDYVGTIKNQHKMLLRK